MRCLPILALAAAVTCTVSAQALEDRTFRFHNATTEQDYQDLSAAALTISGLKAKSMDASTRELSVRGLGEQIRVADWVVAELDRPIASTPTPPSNLFTLITKEAEDTIRVFYPGQSLTDQAFMEAVRVIGDIRYVAAYTSRRAVALRGTPEQIKLAEWLLAEMNRDSPQDTFVFPRGRTEGRTEADRARAEETRVRVFRFVRGNVRQFNDVQIMIRVLTDMRHVYPYVSRHAIVLRGTEEEVDMARWVLAQVDRELPATPKTSSGDYPMKAGELMRIFYFSDTMAPQTFLELYTNIRTATGIRRLYPFATARILAIRGTAAQIAQAAALASQ